MNSMRQMGFVSATAVALAISVVSCGRKTNPAPATGPVGAAPAPAPVPAPEYKRDHLRESGDLSNSLAEVNGKLKTAKDAKDASDAQVGKLEAAAAAKKTESDNAANAVKTDFDAAKTEVVKVFTASAATKVTDLQTAWKLFQEKFPKDDPARVELARIGVDLTKSVEQQVGLLNAPENLALVVKNKMEAKDKVTAAMKAEAETLSAKVQEAHASRVAADAAVKKASDAKWDAASAATVEKSVTDLAGIAGPVYAKVQIDAAKAKVGALKAAATARDTTLAAVATEKAANAKLVTTIAELTKGVESAQTRILVRNRAAALHEMDKFMAVLKPEVELQEASIRKALTGPEMMGKPGADELAVVDADYPKAIDKFLAHADLKYKVTKGIDAALVAKLKAALISAGKTGTFWIAAVDPANPGAALQAASRVRSHQLAIVAVAFEELSKKNELKGRAGIKADVDAAKSVDALHLAYAVAYATRVAANQYASAEKVKGGLGMQTDAERSAEWAERIAAAGIQPDPGAGDYLVKNLTKLAEYQTKAAPARDAGTLAKLNQEFHLD